MTSSPFQHAVAVAVLSLFAVLPASAALAPQYEEWARGPVQWIMTAEEKKAWKQVRTDDEASHFIDLFWVRRDPTFGTAQNEYRDEFDGRVRWADANLAERGRRGSLSDRGRVYVLLGNPTSGNSEIRKSTGAVAQSEGGVGGFGNSRQTGGRVVWTWEFADAQKFDLPHIEVVFVENMNSGRTTRDVQRRDFMAAEPAAIRKAIVNPTLTEVPEWAPTGGLTPRIMVVNVPFANAPATPATPAAPVAPAAPPVPAAPAAQTVYAPRGASRLTLVRDVYAIDTETKVNPFDRLAAVDTWKAADELGWASQYCAGAEDDPLLTVTLRITGTASGEVIDRAAAPDEIAPDRVKASPGCYMLRGAVPLEGMNPGQYKLSVTIEDPKAPGAHTLERDFRIE